MGLVHAFDPPERFVVGTVGPPGQREFFIQARTGPRTCTVSLEKTQVEVLAARVDDLLDQVMNAGNQATIPAIAPLDRHDDGPLEFPIVADFRGGTIALGWDPSDAVVVIEVFAFSPEADEDDEPEEMVQVRIDAGAARAFVERTGRVVRAGRPDCPFCGEPVDPNGHLCVRANGFKRRDR